MWGVPRYNTVDEPENFFQKNSHPIAQHCNMSALHDLLHRHGLDELNHHMKSLGIMRPSDLQYLSDEMVNVLPIQKVPKLKLKALVERVKEQEKDSIEMEQLEYKTTKFKQKIIKIQELLDDQQITLEEFEIMRRNEFSNIYGSKVREYCGNIFSLIVRL